MMMNITTDKEIDNAIRSALKNADEKGKLDIVAAVTGVAGGEQYLREIMNSKEILSVMDRGVLGIHLAS